MKYGLTDFISGETSDDLKDIRTIRHDAFQSAWEKIRFFFFLICVSCFALFSHSIWGFIFVKTSFKKKKKTIMPYFLLYKIEHKDVGFMEFPNLS